jgi:protein transport protein SEC24
MFLWLGIGLSSEFTNMVFGAQYPQQVDTERSGLPIFDNKLSKRIRDIIENIQSERTRCMKVNITLKHLKKY